MKHLRNIFLSLLLSCSMVASGTVLYADMLDGLPIAPWAIIQRVLLHYGLLSGASVVAFGAKCDGINNDGPAIQAAENALEKAIQAGGTLSFPAGICAISAGLTVGNGNSTTLSTSSRIAWRGAGGGQPSGLVSSQPSSNGTTIKYIGASNSGLSMLTVNGPFVGFQITDIEFDGNANAGTDLNLVHVAQSYFLNLSIVNFTSRGIILTSYPATTAINIGCNYNLFQNTWISAISTTNAIGFLIGPAATSSGILDCAGNTYINTNVYFGGGTTNRCIQLQYTDEGTFISTITQCTAATSSVGIYLQNPSDSTIWPSGIQFYTTGIVGGVAAAGTWTGTGIGFHSYATGDGEPIPTIPGTYGNTNTGVSFYAPVVVSASSCAAIPYQAGIISVTDETVSGITGVYILGGPSAVLLGQSSAANYWVAPTTSPAAGKYSVAYNGSSSYEICNGNAAGPVQFGVNFLTSRMSD